LLSVPVFSDEIIDLNGDGVGDIFYQYHNDGYEELIDRNFDGKVDEISRYNKSHYLLSSKADDDFNGYFETILVYRNSFIYRVFVDSDEDWLIDIYSEFTDSIVSSSERYYKKVDGRGARTAKVEYSFGYPKGEKIFDSGVMSPKEFDRKARVYKMEDLEVRFCPLSNLQEEVTSFCKSKADAKMGE
jgi:hypothetical protein